jgi:hypothetical protein
MSAFQPMPLQLRKEAFDHPGWLLERIVAKHKFGPYVTERESSTWVKILNRGYSQKQGREELFERDRHKEPVPGWHSCAIACVELEAR